MSPRCLINRYCLSDGIDVALVCKGDALKAIPRIVQYAEFSEASCCIYSMNCAKGIAHREPQSKIEIVCPLNARKTDPKIAFSC